jgi:hypothetical protein
MHMPGHKHHRRLAPIVWLAVIAVLPAGCTAHRPATAAPPAAAAHAEHQSDAAAHAAAAPVPTSAPDRALRLQALLGQHSILAADMMRGRIRGDDDFAQAADAALSKNTDDMTQLIGALFGAAAAKAFKPKWEEHVVALFAYAKGVADQDKEEQADARQELIGYEQELAAFFVSAAHGRLPSAAANAAVRMHVDHLLMQADLYAAKDYAKSDQIYRESYEHTYDLGGVISAALLPPKEAAELRTPMWRLRSALGKLLAEHVVVLEDASRAAVTNAPDFAAAGQLVNANTTGLAAAIGTLFGAPAAQSFQSLWAGHVDQLIAYASAAATHDTARQEQARAGLATFETRMAMFLEGATGKRLAETTLAAALKEHDQALLQHADAYAAKDYTTAHDIAYQTYAHMTELARQLANAFGSQVAARLPAGAPQTGYGGMADLVEHR